MFRDYFGRYDAAGQPTSFKKFTLALGIFEAMGAVVVILSIAWVNSYRDGFDWGDKDLVFNYHPVFMILGMIFLYGNSMLVYRVFRNERKWLVKVIHAVIHILAWLFGIVGLKAVFDHHNREDPPIPNLYSLHSWIGIVTFVGFSLQWVAGFFCYLFPKAPMGIRRWYMPIHVNAGIIMFIMSIIAAISGLTEKAFFSMNGHGSSPAYKDLPAEGVLMNFIGVFILVKAFALYYIVTQPQFKRPPEDEEMIRLGELEHE